MLLLLPLATHVMGLMTLTVFWGLAIMSFGLALQSKVLQLAPDATDVAMSLFSGLYNVGIGGGALLGSIVSLHYGLQSIGMVGGVLGLIGCVICFVMIKRPDFMPKKALH